VHKDVKADCPCLRARLGPGAVCCSYEPARDSLILAQLYRSRFASPQKRKILAIGAVAGFQQSRFQHSLGPSNKAAAIRCTNDTIHPHVPNDNNKQKIAAAMPRTSMIRRRGFLQDWRTRLEPQQKKDLLAFVHDDGKGFIGVHSATDTCYEWHEYGDMTGGYFKENTWGVFEAQ